MTNNKREFVWSIVLLILIAFIDISAMPFALIKLPTFGGIEPIYFSIFLNFILDLILILIFKRFLCPSLDVSFKKVKSRECYIFFVASIIISGLTATGFILGVRNSINLNPSISKFIVEIVIYNFVLAIVEEFYIRGLLLNIIEKFFEKNKNATLYAVLISSSLFAVGHIFGMLDSSLIVIVTRLIMVLGLGILLGVSYKRTASLWTPIIIHFIINFGSFIYIFTDKNVFTNVASYFIIPLYIIVGILCTIYFVKRKK